MKESEREEISRLPSEYRPLSAWGYFGYSILFAIPLIGFICLIIFSFNDSNINRRSFARSYFCAFILAVIVLVVIIVLGGGIAAIGEIVREIINR